MSFDAILKTTAEQFGDEIGQRVAWHLAPLVEKLERTSGTERPLPGLLSLKELAELLGVPRDTLRRSLDEPESGIPNWPVSVIGSQVKYSRARYQNWLATGDTEARP